MMDRLLVLTSQAGEDLQNLRDTPDSLDDHNAADSGSADASIDTSTDGFTRTGIVILWILVFCLLSIAWYCIMVDKARRAVQANTASDNNTIASKEDAEDIEAPTATNANENDGEDDEEDREANIPVVVVVTSSEESV